MLVSRIWNCASEGLRFYSSTQSEYCRGIVYCPLQVLVGPTDWKDHASGKIPGRFRTSNLSSNYSGAGIFELGVTPPAWLPPQRSNYSGFLKPQDVVVVYLGCAENVYQHLFRIGQTGAHLEGARSTRLFAVGNETASKSAADVQSLSQSRSFNLELGSLNMSLDRGPGGDGGYMSGGSRPMSNASMDGTNSDAHSISEHHKRTSSYDQAAGIRSPSRRGPRLFSEVFALGCSIAFRWSVTENKIMAEKAEADLIEVFDYAWKRGGNFRQRSSDVVSKIVMGGALGSNDPSYDCFGVRSSRTWFFSPKSKVGVVIAARKPGIQEGCGRAGSRADRSRVADFFTLFKSSSQLGGKISKSSEFTKFDIPLDRCGAPLENGNPCNALPVKGGKRCLLHKDSKKQNQGKQVKVVLTPQSSIAHHIPSSRAGSSSPETQHHIHHAPESPILPGPEPTSSSCFPFSIAPASVPSRSSPEPKRRGSLSFNSWLRTSELRMAKSREWAEMNQAGAGNSRPDGPKRSSTYSGILPTCEESQLESSVSRSPSRRDICGLRLPDGTVCADPPRPERKRCEAHKGLRNTLAPRSPTHAVTPTAQESF
uniref:Uncharacterized protein n=1 Tax=Physcomitrium patens TaxID=3218 RepID=A0A7I4FR91_PHYPA